MWQFLLKVLGVGGPPPKLPSSFLPSLGIRHPASQFWCVLVTNLVHSIQPCDSSPEGSQVDHTGSVSILRPMLWLPLAQIAVGGRWGTKWRWRDISPTSCFFLQVCLESG